MLPSLRLKRSKAKLKHKLNERPEARRGTFRAPGLRKIWTSKLIGKRKLYPNIAQKNKYDKIKTRCDFLAYADGKTNIFEIVQSLSLGYIKIGEVDKAIEILEEWLLLHPNDNKAIEWMNLIKSQT